MIAFNHVYVERAAAAYPLTQSLLERVAPRHITHMEDAERFFKRPGQDFDIQKRSPRLILAVKQAPFLYRGSERVASFGMDHPVYYNDMVRNCLFDCDYCFLQGMHRSANILLNVNMEDYLTACDRHIDEHGHLYVSISYLSDLLGFERAFGLARRWIEAVRSRRKLEIEVRTKSDGFSAIADVEPHDGVVLTWSLSPDILARGSEAGTAAFGQRLLDARRAADRGWRVRLCFDPVVAARGWRAAYERAIDQVFSRLDVDRVEAVSFGVFRMHPDFLARMGASRRDQVLKRGITTDDTVATYDADVRNEVFAFMRNRLRRGLPDDRIHAVHG